MQPLAGLMHGKCISTSKWRTHREIEEARRQLLRAPHGQGQTMLTGGAIPPTQQPRHWLQPQPCPSQLLLNKHSSRSSKATAAAKEARTLLHAGEMPNRITSAMGYFDA